MTSFESRTADYPIEEMFLQRWSPRAFTGEAMNDETLMTIFEAARWAPSTYNSQPWRFLYAHHGTPQFDKILGVLIPMNQDWAKNAAVLMIAVSKIMMAPRGAEMESYSHSFDTGASWQNMALQASKLGWYAHGMTGFDAPRAKTEFGVPDGYRVEAAIALGRRGDKSILPEFMQGMEVMNGRNPVSSFAFSGDFPSA